MNKKEPKSFILYCNFENQFKLLSLEERGILISAIFEYARKREFSVELPPLVNMAFSLIKDTMDRDYEDYIERCEINAINGRKGGRPRKREESDDSPIVSKTERFSEKAKKAYNDNDNGNDNDSDNDIDNDIDNGNGNGNGNDIARRERYTPRRCRDEKTGEEVSIAEFCKNLIANLPKAPPSSACSADSVEKKQEEKKDIKDFAPEELHSPKATYALSESDREMLISKGIPEVYIDERADRARDFGGTHKKSAYAVLLEWWEKDRANFGRYHMSKKTEKKNSECDKSFDSDEFFKAACRRTFEEFGRDS